MNRDKHQDRDDIRELDLNFSDYDLSDNDNEYIDDQNYSFECYEQDDIYERFSNIKKYVYNEGLSLCEYLDFNKIKDF